MAGQVAIPSNELIKFDLCILDLMTGQRGRIRVPVYRKRFKAGQLR